MASCVQVELAPVPIIHVQVGRDDALLPEQRASENLAQRIDDDAPARDHHVVRVPRLAVGDGMVGRVVLLLRKLAGREDEAPALERDVRHRALPERACIDSGCAVDLGSLRVVPCSHCKMCLFVSIASPSAYMEDIRRGM